jgi:hypothetical protein
MYYGCTHEVPLVRRREFENVYTAACLRDSYKVGISREQNEILEYDQPEYYWE